MSDIFRTGDAQQVLKGKDVAVFGGSVMRGLYKDIIWLVNDNSLIPSEVLGDKAEKHFPNLNPNTNGRWRKSGKRPSKRIERIFHPDNKDELLGSNGLHEGRSYVEPRRYINRKLNLSVNYIFTSKVFHEGLQDFIENFREKNGKYLDLVIFNSCLWDVNRWGPFGIENFKENITNLLHCAKRNVTDHGGKFLWITNQPPGKLNSRAMRVPPLDFQSVTTKYNVAELNAYAAEKVGEFDMNVVDTHFGFLLLTSNRLHDGIHWNPEANRLVTNMVLTNYSLTLNQKLPGRVGENYALEKLKNVANDYSTDLFQQEFARLSNIDVDIFKPPENPDISLPDLRQLKSFDVSEMEIPRRKRKRRREPSPTPGHSNEPSRQRRRILQANRAEEQYYNQDQHHQQPDAFFYNWQRFQNGAGYYYQDDFNSYQYDGQLNGFGASFGNGCFFQNQNFEGHRDYFTQNGGPVGFADFFNRNIGPQQGQPRYSKR